MRNLIRSRGGVVAVLAAAAVLHPVGHASAEPTATVLTGTVFLPDGSPAVAAVVDLMLADPTGQPVAGSAFARGITRVDGSFSVDPPEREDLVAAARANGGTLPVAVQVADLAPHGSIDPNAAADTRDADLSALTGITVLTLTGGSGDGFTIPGSPIQVYRVFDLVGDPPDLDNLTIPDPSLIYDGVELVLNVVRSVAAQAAFAGMFNDPDLVAGNDNPNDPDLVPPLGSIMSDVVPVMDTPLTGVEASPDGGIGGVPGVSLDRVGSLPLPTPANEGGGGASCGKDPGTYWVTNRHGNAPDGTKTYVYRDTFSCTGDNDRTRDEVVYKWGGYTGSADGYRWSIYRLKFRTEINDKYNYYMKYPDPVGDKVDGDGGSLTWTVGFDYVATANVSGKFNFRAKKIHGWQADGTGRLYHVSWIAGSKGGSFSTDGLNNGGGVNFDVPQGSDGRAGVRNNVIIWKCFWNPQANYQATCDTTSV